MVEFVGGHEEVEAGESAVGVGVGADDDAGGLVWGRVVVVDEEGGEAVEVVEFDGGRGWGFALEAFEEGGDVVDAVDGAGGGGVVAAVGEEADILSGRRGRRRR